MANIDGNWGPDTTGCGPVGAAFAGALLGFFMAALVIFFLALKSPFGGDWNQTLKFGCFGVALVALVLQIILLKRRGFGGVGFVLGLFIGICFASLLMGVCFAANGG